MRPTRWIGLGPLALVLLASCGGSGGGHPTWSKSIGGEARDELLGVASSADGVFLAGAFGMEAHGLAGDDGDLWALRLDYAGNIEWQRAIGQRNVVAPGQVPPTLRALAVDAAGTWLAGRSAAGNALVARLDPTGGTTWTLDFATHKPERFEVGWAVAAAGSGAVVGVWADDVVTESDSDGHPGTPDNITWEAPRWRVRVLSAAGDGTAGWARTLPPLYTEREPQGLVVAGFPDGGAAVAVSLEDSLDVTRLGPDGAILWTLERSGQDDAHGLIPLPGGDVVAFGDSVGLPGRRGFATRFALDGSVTWHEHYSEVDRLTAGALACPPGQACHLALAGQDYGAIVPSLSDALLVDLDGKLVAETESVALGPAAAVGYDPATDRYSVTTHPWNLQLETQALDPAFARLGDPRRVVQDGPGAAATGPDGRTLWLSHTPARLLAYGAGNAPLLYEITLAGRERRLEAGGAVLPMGGGALVTGQAGDGSAWGVRLDEFGAVQWQRRWELRASRQHQLAPGPDGGFWMAAGGVLGRFSADGTPVATFASAATGQALAAWREGGVLAVGGDRAAAWDASAALSFRKRYSMGAQWLSLEDAVAVGEGAMAVGVYDDGQALLALRLDARGEVLAATGLRSTTGVLRGEASVAAVDGRAVLAVTWQSPNAADDVLLVALDDAGGVAWTRRYGGLLDDRVSDVVASPGGGLIVAGSSSTVSTDFDGWVLRLDADGLVDQEGACQALLQSPALTVENPVVTAGDFTADAYDWRPGSTATLAQSSTPPLQVARQCVGQAATPDPDASDAPDGADAPDTSDAGPDLPPDNGFGIQTTLGGAPFAAGQPVPRYSTVTLRAIVPGSLTDYTYQWFTGPAADPSPIGTGPEIDWLMESAQLFRLVISQGGAPVAEVSRAIDLQIAQVTADLVVCPSAKPYAAQAIQLRASSILNNATIPLTDHPAVASIAWTLDPYFLTPAAIDPGPPLTHTSTDSIWHLDPGTLTTGAWYEAFARALDADGNEVALSNAASFEVSAIPQVSTCGPPP
ncbi:MAG: hypothetical protein R3F39_25460 [Myxococcota bacterium]